MLRFLMKVGANPRTTDSDGRTALHYAASCSASASAAAECIQLIVNHGAQVDSYYSTRKTRAAHSQHRIDPQ